MEFKNAFNSKHIPTAWNSRMRGIQKLYGIHNAWNAKFMAFKNQDIQTEIVNVIVKINTFK